MVELDIASSHLTIINSLLGFTGDDSDPYKVEGIPRDVVKAWVTMCLGYGKFHQKWSDEASKRYHRTCGGDLEADYPLLQTRERLKAALPTIGRALDKGLGWARLQYIESCAIIAAVETLAFKYGIPALPIHDSLIVGASSVDLARSVLEATFLRNVGVTPRLELK